MEIGLRSHFWFLNGRGNRVITSTERLIASTPHLLHETGNPLPPCLQLTQRADLHSAAKICKIEQSLGLGGWVGGDARLHVELSLHETD